MREPGICQDRNPHNDRPSHKKFNRPQKKADEHKENSGNAAHGNDRTDGRRVSGEEQKEPWKCDQIELITDSG